jgi:hypothetical protein
MEVIVFMILLVVALIFGPAWALQGWLIFSGVALLILTLTAAAGDGL